MTRNELQENLKSLGFKKLCDDNKTLCAYNSIQYILKCNHTPIKNVERVYLCNNYIHLDLNNGFDVEIGYSFYDEE